MFDLSEINYHITVMLIWSTAALVHLPSVLVWAHNYRYSTKLEPDPAFWNGVILSVCAGVLWQGNLPRPDLIYYDELGNAMFTLACVALAFTQFSLYRLGPVLTTAVALITVHHLLAPWFTPKPIEPPAEEGGEGEEEEIAHPTLSDSITPDEDGGEEEGDPDCRAMAETLTNITEQTEELSEDPTESDDKVSDFDKLTPTSDSDPELCSSNASVSSFENISATEITKNATDEC
ncbi:hypothetical protein LSTR_LSTR011395 [Laodelphax striatellus]|uniref:Uncharacterized protein n=1 Tax=Laodelphax striatellus TaxID=195883 RepID=A0A482XSP0_LAOST|nr:hypothetical protein LSTR_LSTR011395 [Laodelphax striatellus]